MNRWKKALQIADIAAMCPPGQQLTFDTEGRLTGWQDAQSSPTNTETMAYDDEGNRVAQQSASGGVTTQSVYVGSLMEVKSVTGTPSPGNIVY